MNDKTNNTINEFKNINYSKILNRIISLIKDPNDTWSKIKTENIDVRSTYINYLIPVSVIVAIANFIKLSFVGTLGFKMTVQNGLTQSIISLILGLVFVYAFSFILSFLSKQSFSENELTQEDSFKVLAFTMILSLATTLLGLVPMIGGLLSLLVGLYSIYILYIGIKNLSGSESPILLTIIFIVSIAIISAVVGLLIAGLYTTGVPDQNYNEVNFNFPKE